MDVFRSSVPRPSDNDDPIRQWDTGGHAVLRRLYSPEDADALRELLLLEFDAVREPDAGPVHYLERTGGGAGARMMIYYGTAHRSLPAKARLILDRFYRAREDFLRAIAPEGSEGMDEIQSAAILTGAGQRVEPHDDAPHVRSPAISLLHLSRRDVHYGGAVFQVTVRGRDGGARRISPALDMGDVVFFPPAATHEVSTVEWGRRLVLSVGRPSYGPEVLRQ